jgi:hypothetical protein
MVFSVDGFYLYGHGDGGAWEEGLHPALDSAGQKDEWFANIRNASTRRPYETAIEDFMGFTGIGHTVSDRVSKTQWCFSPAPRSGVTPPRSQASRSRG